MDQMPCREASLARSWKSSRNAWSGRGARGGGSPSPPLHLGSLTLVLHWAAGGHEARLPTVFRKPSRGHETQEESWLLMTLQLAVSLSVLTWPSKTDTPSQQMTSPFSAPPGQELSPKPLLASRSVLSLQQGSPSQTRTALPALPHVPNQPQPHQPQKIK